MYNANFHAMRIFVLYLDPDLMKGVIDVAIPGLNPDPDQDHHEENTPEARHVPVVDHLEDQQNNRVNTVNPLMRGGIYTHL